MLARDVMTPNVITLNPGNSTRHAAQLMLEQRISGYPVIDDNGKLVGMLTEGDLIRRVEYDVRAHAPDISPQAPSESRAREYVRTRSWKVGDVMSTDLVTVDEETHLGAVAELMEKRNIRRIPVTREGKLVGIVARADLLHFITDDRTSPPARGDAALRTSIRARLVDDAGEVGAIPTVTVEDGVVHVWGSVHSQAQRDAVRVAVEGVQGVAGYVDHLSITPVPLPAPTSSTLEQTAGTS